MVLAKTLISRLIGLFALLITCQGCVYGFIYTDITEPLTTNMVSTPNPEAKKRGTSNLQRVTEPLSGLDIRVELASIAIGDAARAAQIEKIFWADLRYQSVLGGLWQRNTVIVYGE